jgi:hypothetical protein
MVEPERLPVSAELKEDLQAWSDRMTDLMWGPRGPDDPDWTGPDSSDVEALEAEARALHDRLQSELPRGFTVNLRFP